MAKNPQLPRLSPELEEKAYEMILDGETLDNIAVALGLKTRRTFQRYQLQHPEFLELCDRARIAECQYIEEEIRHVASKYSKDYARVELEALTRILKFRDPKKYGDRVNLDSNITIDIAGSLDRAERRVV